MTAACPWCNAPRATGPTCPRCGALYAKAEMIKTQGRASIPVAAAAAPAAAPVAAPVQVMPLIQEPALVENPALELKLCIAAIPVALVLALVFHISMPFLQRTFLAMPVHELGHAVTAWFCGHFAVPTLWKTITAESRGFITPLVLLGALGYLMYRAYTAGKHVLVAVGGALVALQAIGTLVIKPRTVDMLIVFGGDGMGMVLGVALMSTFFFGKGTQLYQGWTRWGFLFIGAAAFVDMFSTWWAARSDFGKVPFGEQEGVGLSDATRLVDDHNWTTDALIHRYVTLGICCLVALAAVYAWGVLRARRYAQAPR
jgi:hypothetical protein